MKFLLWLVLAVLVGCTGATTTTPVVVNQSLVLDGSSSNDGRRWWARGPMTDLDKSRRVSVSVTGAASAPVAFLLTNTSSVSGYRPGLGNLNGDLAPRSFTEDRIASSTEPRVREAVSSLPKVYHARPASRAVVTSEAPPSPALGDTLVFRDTGSGSVVNTPVTLRYRSAQPISGRHLNLWVANDSWDGNTDAIVDAANPNPEPSSKDWTIPWSPPSHLVTPAMLTALADRLLKDGTNDIYGWVTNLLGREWAEGGSPAPEFIDGRGDLHIFVKNLNPTQTSASSGVLMGYFDATNNFRQGAYSWASSSNERILFALDADSLANSDGKAWSTSAYWPSRTISTLAHEFQHMIHFYQKQVRNGLTVQTDAWINEMASMMVEDLVASKLEIPGPRGVPLLDSGYDYSSGKAPLSSGRLLDFLVYHDWISLTGWGDGNNRSTLESYSNAYAFGAWLLRNYGGPTVLRDLVTNSQTNEQAVLRAVANHSAFTGTGPTFAGLVQDWGLATYLGAASVRSGLDYSTYSDSTQTTSVAFTSTLGNATYSLGSINLYNYAYQVGVKEHRGPWTSSSWSETNPIYAGATFFLLAQKASGSVQRYSLLLPPQVALTVVVGSVP